MAITNACVIVLVAAATILLIFYIVNQRNPTSAFIAKINKNTHK